ncbi:MAG: hypothetical protein KIS96_14385 [Bauldia sp.]|nr:hypothetical protein [Bauldia sp.]
MPVIDGGAYYYAGARQHGSRADLDNLDAGVPTDNDVEAAAPVPLDWGTPWEENVLRAAYAAAHVYPGNTSGAFAGVNVADDARYGGRDEREFRRRMHLAADFVRANPGAPAAAIPIHLKRSGFAGLPDTARALAAWSVFAFALAELDRLDREEAEQAAAPAPAWPGKQAFDAPAAPFAPSGFSPA